MVCRLYSTIVTVESQVKLDPYWVTGFIDGEGCFSIRIRKSSNTKIGWIVEATFSIGLHQKDRMVLELLKFYFGVGNIYKHGKDNVQYRVSSLQDLIKIIDHFDKYPLITFFDLPLVFTKG